MLAGGAGLALVRSISKFAWDGVVRKVVLRAEFDSRDDSYRWLVAWLAEHPHYATTKRFSVLTTLRRLGASADPSDSSDSDSVLLIPSGTSFLRHRGLFMIIDRNKEDDKQSASSGRERETLTVHIVGGTKLSLLDLISEARSNFMERQRARTAVYFIAEYGSWTRVSSKPARPGSSVILGKAGQVHQSVNSYHWNTRFFSKIHRALFVAWVHQLLTRVRKHAGRGTSCRLHTLPEFREMVCRKRHSLSQGILAAWSTRNWKNESGTKISKNSNFISFHNAGGALGCIDFIRRGSLNKAN